MRYTVQAHNYATDSGNRIHSDEVARQYGFRGGLVPGVAVYAYLAKAPIDRWGWDWLGHGAMEARFSAPTYDGQEVVVVSADDGDSVLDLSLEGPDGATCATGRAQQQGGPAPDPAGYPVAPLPDERPPASFDALPEGSALGTITATFVAEKEGRAANPLWLLQQANDILTANVVLGPWIHVSSQVSYFATVADGDEVQTRALVAGAYERKGHKFVDLDVLLAVDGEEPVMHARHQAIFEPRRVDG